MPRLRQKRPCLILALAASFYSPLLLAREEGTAGGGQSRSPQEEGESAGAKIVAPRLISEAAVEYPEGVEGDALVSLKLKILKDGSVAEAVVVEGTEPFAALAQASALSWKFSPATQDGEDRAAWILFAVEFVAPVEAPKPEAVAPPLPRIQRSARPTAAPAEEELVISVRGIRTPGSTRVMTDDETTIIPGAEGDPIRALEILPGTVPIVGSGPFIGLRGASSGMLGYVYDGIEVPYLFHLAGGSSVVHPWMVESATIYGTGGPARLGRSGVGTIEATAAEPEGRARASARLRITDAALGLEVPFHEGRGSVLLAGRYSYTKPLVSLVAPEFSLDYWDYQGRVRYDLRPSDTIELLSFGSGDTSAIVDEEGRQEDLFHASFHRTALRYTHRRKEGGSHRVGLTLGHDKWEAEPNPIQPFLSSMTVRFESSMPVGARSQFDYGGDVGLRFQTDYYEEAPDSGVESYDRTDLATAGWFDWTYQLSSRTSLSAGLRLDVYASGESKRSDKAADIAPQPRVALSHHLNDWARWHQSIGLAAQLPSPTQRPPGRMYSVDGGLERSALSDAGVEWYLPAGITLDTTAFHNVFFNVKDVEQFAYIDGQSGDLERGKGQAAGLELSLRRSFARHFRTFASYTYTYAWRSVGRVVGEVGRPHVFDLAMAYDFGRGWDLNGRVRYYTGYPARVSQVSEVANAPRATSYYQIDWQVAKKWEDAKTGRWWGVTMGILNTTMNSESNSLFCTEGQCQEEFVGPATIPTIGIEGEL